MFAAYLSFLERDMSEHPERLRPFTEADIARIHASRCMSRFPTTKSFRMT